MMLFATNGLADVSEPSAESIPVIAGALFLLVVPKQLEDNMALAILAFALATISFVLAASDGRPIDER